MKQELKEMIDKRTEKIRSTVKMARFVEYGWVYNFFEMLSEFSFSVENFDQLFESALREENFQAHAKTCIMHEGRYPSNNYKGHNQAEFFERLKEKINGEQDAQKFLSEMIEFAQKDIEKGGNFYASLVKYAMLKYPDEIETEENIDNDDDGESQMFLKFWGLYLTSSEFQNARIFDEHNTILLTEIRTVQDMQGLRLGQILMERIAQRAINQSPETDLVAWNVMSKNVGAQRFYIRNGGKLATDYEAVRQQKFIEQEGYQALGEHATGLVHFDRETTAKMVELKTEPMTLDEYKAKQKKKEAEAE